MKIDWYRIRYIKGVMPFLHRARVLVSFMTDYVFLVFKRRCIKGETPNRKFVVINLLEHFGDIVACEPVARYARQTYPDAFIMWSVRKQYRDILDHNPAIDHILTISCVSEWMLLRKSGLFDEIIDLQLEGKECPVCRIPLRKDTGNLAITTETYYSYGNLLAAFCQGAGLSVIEDQPRVHIPDETIRRIDRIGLPKNFVAVHCSSNEESRDWPREKWQQLTRMIMCELGLQIVEIGLKPVLNLGSEGCVNLCGRLTLLETAEVIRRARLFIGIDSGPAHLANAVGTFGIILLGEYRMFRRYTPYSGGYKTGENAILLHHAGPVADIPINAVYDAVAGSLPTNGGFE